MAVDVHEKLEKHAAVGMHLVAARRIASATCDEAHEERGAHPEVPQPVRSHEGPLPAAVPRQFIDPGTPILQPPRPSAARQIPRDATAVPGVTLHPARPTPDPAIVASPWPDLPPLAWPDDLAPPLDDGRALARRLRLAAEQIG